jgi:hypothetical protein
MLQTVVSHGILREAVPVNFAHRGQGETHKQRNGVYCCPLNK